MIQTKLKWNKEMAFETELNGHTFYLDAAKEFGGQDLGPSPKGLLLSALAGCTGMDVVSMLKKMKVKDFEYEMKVSGETATEHPKTFTVITLDYYFNGEDLPLKKIRKAISLSKEKYCAVSAMLNKSATINVRIFINSEEFSL